MKLLRCYFYHFYQLMISVGNDDVAEYYAIILMTMILYSNFIFLSILSFVFLGLNIDLGFGSKLLTGLIFLGLLIFFYFLFIVNDRYVAIAKEYENEISSKRIFRNIVTIGYIIVSVGLLMLGYFLMAQKNRGLI